MSVLKAKRKPSPFEVEHHAYKIRAVITDLALRKFGLKEYVPRARPPDYEKWSESQKNGYDKSIQKNMEEIEQKLDELEYHCRKYIDIDDIDIN